MQLLNTMNITKHDMLRRKNTIKSDELNNKTLLNAI